VALLKFAAAPAWAPGIALNRLRRDLRRAVQVPPAPITALKSTALVQRVKLPTFEVIGDEFDLTRVVAFGASNGFYNRKGKPNDRPSPALGVSPLVDFLLGCLEVGDIRSSESGIAASHQGFRRLGGLSSIMAWTAATRIRAFPAGAHFRIRKAHFAVTIELTFDASCSLKPAEA
jgi:hypothetical protein